MNVKPRATFVSLAAGARLAFQGVTMAPFSRDPEAFNTAIDPQLYSHGPGIEPAHAPARITRAMAKFSCIAGACEDTCCRDWAVPLSRPDLDRLRGAMVRAKDGHDRFVRLVVIGSPASRPPHYAAHIALDENSVCPELDGEHRCRSHIELGEAALPTACSVFPRTSLATEDGLEVGGSLACPEAARLALLTDDALAFVDADEAALPRPYVGKTIPHADGNAWTRFFLPVRNALLAIFDVRDVPVAGRMAAAALLADRVGAFYRANTTSFHGASGRFAERQLMRELTAARDPESVRGAHVDACALPLPTAPATEFVMSTLQQRLKLGHPKRFQSLLARVAAVYDADMRALDNGTLHAASAVYVRRRDELDAAYPDTMARILTNLCKHHLLRHPFTDHGTLLESLGLMAAEIAIVRYLVAGHPDVVAATRERNEDGRCLVEGAAVEVAQTCAKAIAHHVPFRDALTASLAADGAATMARVLLFARFL